MTLTLPDVNWWLVGALVLVVALVGWKLAYPAWLYLRRATKRVERPTAQDSDKRAPVGTHEWMREVLEALGDAPADLKLTILQNPQTTVALALKAHNDHLRKVGQK